MNAKYCWSCVSTGLVGRFNSREDAIADFRKSLRRGGFDLDPDATHYVTVHEFVSAVQSSLKKSAIDIGFRTHEIVTSIDNSSKSCKGGLTGLTHRSHKSLGDAIITWYTLNNPLLYYRVTSPTYHVVTAKDND